GDMVHAIEELGAKGHTYSSDGSVYFRIASFPEYGKLSHNDFAGHIAGARVDVDSYEKADARDFALWKAPKEGEPFWTTEIGPGRPGWHIECSAMAMQYLGESFDFHGGGEDLIFPHHENEIAQAEGATGKPVVRCWSHNGFVNLGSEKMSKSLGNTLWIRDMVRRHEPEALRLYFLGTHYRHPLEYADERVVESAKALGRLRSLVQEAERIARGGPPPPGRGDAALLNQVDAHVARFIAVMDDDFNTPQALAVLFDLLRALYAGREQGAGAGAFVAGVGKLVELARVLGLLEQVARPQAAIDPQLKACVESLIYLREQARKQRDFAEADRLRNELAALNVTLKDSRDGTTWTIAQ
ncbi:MAG TPA: DALR domain-containing protein, partial [Myxococcota bacterium]|nr:DALR domain-containing protein [Myxococcota bacterium]